MVHIMKKRFELVDSSVSVPEIDEFAPTNLNLVFRIPERYTEEFVFSTKQYGVVDSTFEVQVRTIFSEGWHEVEHDLRYKCKDFWDGNADLSRVLNGIFASLLSSEWAMEKLFNDLAYRHYKEGKWEAMLRNKLRLRMSYAPLSAEIANVITHDPSVGKRLYRCDRRVLVKCLYLGEAMIPMYIDNIVYLANYISVGCSAIAELTPKPFLQELEDSVYIKNIAIQNC